MDRNRVVLWVARIWAAFILAFVLLFMIPGTIGEDSGDGLRDAREVLTFISFPVCTIVGLAPGLLYLAYWLMARTPEPEHG